MASRDAALPGVPKWVWIFPIVFVALIVGAVTWMRAFYAQYQTYAYRYRMTVSVQDGAQVHSGSSVVEVRLKQKPKIFPEDLSLVPSAAGEAVFVDLGDGRHVVALLTSGPTGAGAGYPMTLVPRHFGLTHEDRDLPRFPQLEGAWTLSSADMPTFVTFARPDDPATVRVVAPADFAQVFGSQYRLNGVTVEMTTDPVTSGIERRLPWLEDRISKGLGTRIDTQPGVFVLNVPYFKREEPGSE
jgi:hypothetical protein